MMALMGRGGAAVAEGDCGGENVIVLPCVVVGTTVSLQNQEFEGRSRQPFAQKVL